MMRRALPLLVIAVLLTVAGSKHADAQDPVWRAWLFNGTDQLVLVDGERQAIREVILPLTENHPDVLSIAAAPTGDVISYVARDGNSSAYERVVLDTVTGDTRTIENRTSQRGISGRAAFDPTGRYLVYTDAVEQAIKVLDLRNGSSPFVLDTSAPDLPFNQVVTTDIVPMVMRFDGERVWFYIGSDPDPTVITGKPGRGYIWYVRTNTVSESAAYPAPYTTTFAPTGETLTVVRDGSGERVEVYDPVFGARWPFYANTLLPTSVDGVTFVQNGERVLYQSTAAIPVDLLVRRDGTIERVLRPINRISPHPTADGLIYILFDEDRSELVHVDTRRLLSDRVIWQGEGFWTIIWVDTGTRTLPAYEPWAVLSEPITYDAPVPIIDARPTPLPAPSTVLNPGMTVRVITNGDVLYLRDEAGTSGEILMYLYDNDRVTLLDGPVSADGFVWWQVEAADGTVGWAAAASGEVSTLLPLESVIPTQTPEA